jgi:uncharacterized protein involved in exopolysaccharide biosynthesis
MSTLTQDQLAYAAPDDEGQSKSLGEMLGILVRWRWLMLLVFVAMFVLGAVVAFTLPAVYRSSATILIKEQEIPQEMVRSTVTSFADERIQVISQQVMTRATLLDLVDKYGLYGKARQRETSEDILDRMRRDIKLTPISADVTNRSGSSGRATIAFTLSYDSEVAANAQKIANDLATLYLNENVKNRQQKAAETTAFLDEELTRVTAHISELETSLAAFKRRNQGRTPDLAQSNLFSSERLELDLQRVEREISFLSDRKLALEGQLADTKPNSPLVTGGVLEPEDRLRSLQSQLASLTALYSESHPDVKRVRREIAGLQAEAGVNAEADAPRQDREAMLDRVRAELAALRKRYPDQNPDVVKLRRTVQSLEAAVAAAPAASGVRGPRKPDNPSYLTLKSQVQTTESQIESLMAERVELKNRLSDVTVRLSQSPEIERELLGLIRDLDSSRGRFRELRDKQMQAQVAEQLERSRKAERFTIIEPPVFPEKPNRPNRQLILMLGVVVAVAGALASGALAHALDGKVHGSRDLVRLMQVPVLAVLPPLPVPDSERRQAKAKWIMMGIGLTALALSAAAIHSFYMPLDVVWYGLLRRLGA